MRNRLLTILSIFILSLSILSCATSNLDFQRDARHTFVKIKQNVAITVCNPADPKECLTKTSRSTGSGAVVMRTDEGSYVLTAGHSCESKIPKTQIVDGFRIESNGSKFKAIDLNGFKHSAEVVMTNSRFDLCLLRVSDVISNPPVLKVSDKEPKRGETVTNMAAPHGLFWSGTVLIFKGQFSGYHDRGFSVYTIPTKPGSSGSPIIDKDNKLVGVIFAGYRMIENVGLSSPLVAIKVFLKKAIAKGEMELWEKGNTPKLDTQIDRIWFDKMKKNLDTVFGN